MKEQNNSSKDPLAVVILAAGKGTRMASPLPKVAVATAEKPMIYHVVDAVAPLNPARMVVVTGYQRETVEKLLQQHACAQSLESVVQEEQLGTGHAVQCAENALRDFTGTVLILCGDVPLVSSDSLRSFIDHHEKEQATISITTADLDAPGSFGRIVRDNEDQFVHIKEAKDCLPQELAIKEINAGVYAVDSAFLWPALKQVTNDNAQNEFYLTDIPQKAVQEGQKVALWKNPNAFETLGVNSLKDLSEINRLIRIHKVEELMTQGVIFEDPGSAYIESNVVIGTGTRIGPNVIIKGSTHIGKNVIIEGSAFITESTIGDESLMKFSVRCEQAHIGPKCSVGPFAQLRPNTTLEAHVKIGNFVETKNTLVKEHSAASHLTYLGDATIGKHCNIGAGTITANYDGANKHTTVLEDDVSVGSNSVLVAPVTIGTGVTIGAGSVMRKDVAPGCLAVTVAPLRTKEGYQKKKKTQE